MTDTFAQSFVFLDLETTGLPCREIGKTRITEMSMISVPRNELLRTDGKLPRTLQKLTLLFNPQKMISDEVVSITGLDNFLLEKEYPFNKKKAVAIKTFLDQCIPPICFVAHNGHGFDFPILQEELKNFADIQVIPEGTRCADTLPAFRYLSGLCTEDSELVLSPFITADERTLCQVAEEVEREMNRNAGDILKTMAIIRATNETTPKAQFIRPVSNHQNFAKRKLFNDAPNVNDCKKIMAPMKAIKRFRLIDVYENLFGEALDAHHRAEEDVITLLKCCLKFGQPILDWFDRNSVKFSEVKSTYDRSRR